ncbi:MAG: KH domain-containing protein [Acidobacteria bacterium]|nr:KH domain-containing protein [Acidobacteriota bacterium]
MNNSQPRVSKRDAGRHTSPEEVSVREIQGEQTTVLELKVAPGDLGKVIGKQGRTARSIRTLLGAAGMKLNRRFTLEILE